MDAARWERLQALFQQAAHGDEDERKKLLARVEEEDAGLAVELRELLATEKSPDDRLAEAIAGGADLLELSSAPAPGHRIGSYRVVEAIARGGMGSVYLAETTQTGEPHRVAIKLIRPGLGGENVARRFRQERKILAGLDNPHIAKLLDAGTTPEGLPYLVMEYVEGIPIDRYCDRNRLSIEHRLDLLQTVCSAVHYAHQHLVVHRDLKPNNILVTESGQPKLLDFGIAKLLERDGSDTPATRTAERLLTPDYASPEQVRGDVVHTTSDVYSLGVVLYEMLTGLRPHQLKDASPVEVVRAICEDRAPKASGVVSGERSSDLTVERADVRGLRPDSLRRRLRGDLDVIVARALQKEPERRYPSVEEFRADLERHRRGLPVLARPDGFAYRARKFLGRHRFEVAGVAGILVLLAGFATTVFFQSKRTARARDRAESILSFVVDLFEDARPDRSADALQIDAIEFLHRGASRIHTEFSTQPDTQAELLATIGNVYGSLGIYDKARELLGESVTAHEELLGREHPRTCRARHDFASLLVALGDHDAATGLLEEVLASQRQRSGKLSPDVAQTLNTLANVKAEMADHEGAESLYRESLEIRRAIRPPDDLAVAETLNDLGYLLHDLADYEGAEPMYREALEIYLARFGERHPDVTSTMGNLGLLKLDIGELDEAERLLRDGLRLNREIFDAEHPAVAFDLNNLAYVLEGRGDLAGAEPLHREALAIRRARLGEDHPDVATSLNNVASIAFARGRYEEASVQFEQALQVLERNYGRSHPDSIGVLSNLASTLHSTGDYEAAERRYLEAIALETELFGREHPSVASNLRRLAGCLGHRGEHERALASATEALELHRRLLGEEHPEVGLDLSLIGQLQLHAGEHAPSERSLREALALQRAALSEGHKDLTQTLSDLGRVLIDTRRPTAAEPLLREARRIQVESTGDGHWKAAQITGRLGAMSAALGRFDEAEPLLRQAHERLRKSRGAEDRATREVRRDLERLPR